MKAPVAVTIRLVVGAAALSFVASAPAHAAPATTTPATSASAAAPPAPVAAAAVPTPATTAPTTTTAPAHAAAVPSAGARAASAAAAAVTQKNAAQARDAALASPVAWDVLTSLTTEIGARPTGSPAAARARDWGVRTLKALGFKNVHVESFVKKNAWLRGKESAALVAPYPMQLMVLGLGNSAATPAGGITADVAVFPSLEALSAAPTGSLVGKIAVVNQPMTRTQSGEGYGAAVQARGAGAGIAESKGAVAFLTRSITTSNGRLPHTGAAHPAKIAAGALGVADADLLERLAAKGTARITLVIEPVVLPETEAWNVVGEIPGRDKDVVVIGGHLDSWDPGEGAQDDGAGVAITVAAAKVVGDARKPKRTIRVVLFGSEETGGSGDAYATAHASEVPQIASVAESDIGAGPVFKMSFMKGVADDPAMAGLKTALGPLRVYVDEEPAQFAGSDMEGLEKAGAPIVQIDADASKYFDVHHSADDTLDKIDRADLDQSAAAWATVLTYLVDTIDMRKPTTPPTAP